MTVASAVAGQSDPFCAFTKNMVVSFRTTSPGLVTTVPSPVRFLSNILHSMFLSAPPFWEMFLTLMLVALPPLHTGFAPSIVSVGLSLIVMVCVAVPGQFFSLYPVTWNTWLVPIGATITVSLSFPRPVQRYFFPAAVPLATNWAVSP